MSEPNESQATAIAHLEMIFQAATGEYKPKAGELEKRRAALVAFIQTGQCVASDGDRSLIERIKSAFLAADWTSAA